MSRILTSYFVLRTSSLLKQSKTDPSRPFLIVLFILGIAFLFLLRPLLIAICLAAIVTILLYPTYSLILKYCKGRRYLASFIATFLIFLVLVLPAGLITALIINQIIDFVSTLNTKGAFSFILSLSFYQSYVQPIVESLNERFKIDIDLGALLTNLGKQSARYIYNFSPQVLSNTASFIFNFFVMHFSIYFLFIEGKGIYQTLLDLSPLKAKYETRLTQELKNMIFGTVYGYLLTALVQGILAGIGFWIAGVPAPLVFGTLTFFMSLVPIVGAAAVWIPISIWVFFQGGIGWGIFMAAYGLLVISGIDNIIKPLIIRGKANIHPLLIFFSLFGGITLFGPIGILFGPVITALLLACVRIYREDFITAST